MNRIDEESYTSSIMTENQPNELALSHHNFGDTDSLLNSDEPGHYGTFENQGKQYTSDPALFLPVEKNQPFPLPESAKHHTFAFVYCSHFLSAWGDRMWSFGVGLFLVQIGGSNLQLPATYGLASGLAIFLLGALVGDWVDSTPRLKAAQVSLVLQNLLVVVCAVGVYLYIHYESSVTSVPGGWAVPLSHAGVITAAVIADLASMARVIAVERDWIVKICNRDSNMLANMTATLRRIDQTTLILAPIATGQIMTYAGLENGALFIGAWNLISVAVEYYLIWKVYVTVPALATKENDTAARDRHKQSGADLEASMSFSMSMSHKSISLDPSLMPSAYTQAESDCLTVKTTPLWTEGRKNSGTDVVCSLVADSEILLDDSIDNNTTAVETRPCCSRVLYQFITLYNGWKTYMKYSVALAGIALAFLYMTVLGFDNITVAYAVTQGLSESILGILMGISAIFGMLGTFIYPNLRRRVGLVRTGLLALSAQLLCLTLCVVSIWTPGSPFDPTFSRSQHPVNNLSNFTTGSPASYSSISTELPPAFSIDNKNISTVDLANILLKSTATTFGPSHFVDTVPLPTGLLNSDGYNDVLLSSPENKNQTEIQVTTPLYQAAEPSSTSFLKNLSPNYTEKQVEENYNLWTVDSNATSLPLISMIMPSTNNSTEPTTGGDGEKFYISVILLMAGIVLARTGLWVADLTITQLFMEAVVEKERGVVNGVQNSLNKLMDVLKFALVVAVPDTETFGFLILISFTFIFLGWMLYAAFLRKERGHFFHCPFCHCAEAKQVNRL